MVGKDDDHKAHSAVASSPRSQLSAVSSNKKQEILASQPSQQQKAQPAGTYQQPLVWIDCEMTGLDVQTDTLIEIACIITDGQLEQLVEGPNLVIHQPDEVLNSMNAWCIQQHGASGLTKQVQESNLSMEEAEERILAFVKSLVPEAKQALLAGNTVHMDLAFLRRCMPRLVDHLHYRIVDVSSIAEVCWRWCPELASGAPKKKKLHTALADIKESIEQLAYYKQHCFK